jgi:hypothetical protein
LLRRRSLHLRLNLLGLHLRLLRLLHTLLACLVFAATPAAPMSLRLSLAVRRGRPQIWLRRCRFCRHACTSWHFAVLCITSLESAFSIPGMLSFPLPAARHAWTRNSAAGSFPPVDVVAHFAGEQNSERNLSRILRPTTVERRV